MNKRGSYITPWGCKCKSQMALLKLSMDDLVEKTNFSRYYLSAVINGRVGAPEETIKKINAALNIRSEQMVG